ncbi:MAG: hypothetical protein H6572_06510 [Lewinellaceae bacterium]|nr:hypothetical protein [Lewinellaceae bacterium]
MNLTLSYLLNNSHLLGDEHIAYVKEKIENEPFVQGWRILLEKITQRFQTNDGFFLNRWHFEFGTNQSTAFEAIDRHASSHEVMKSEEIIDNVIERAESIDIQNLIPEKDSSAISMNIIEIKKEEDSSIEDESPQEAIELKSNKKGKKRKEKQPEYDFQGKSNFAKWLFQLNPIVSHRPKPFGKKKKKHKEHKLAKQSVEKRKSVISENLAELLLVQGHYNQAIEMYNQLSLVFPEKSAYFAAKINEIKYLK